MLKSWFYGERPELSIEPPREMNKLIGTNTIRVYDEAKWLVASPGAARLVKVLSFEGQTN